MPGGVLAEQQRLEVNVARIRWGAVALTALLGPQFPNLSQIGVYVLAGGIAAYNVLVTRATSRTRTIAEQRSVAEVAFGADLAALSIAMFLFSADPYWTTFTVGFLVIAAGAFRFGAAGAYASSAVISLAYLAILVFRARSLDLPLEPSRALFHVAVFALMALLVERVWRDDRAVRAEREELIVRLEHQLAENERLFAEASEAAALREMDRLKDEFLAAVSHELRTPLTVIAGSLELLATRHAELGPDARRLVEQAERHVRRLGRSVEELLDLAQLQEARIELQREFVAPEALLGEVAAAHEPVLAAKRQRVLVSAGATLPPVLVDRRRMQQILGNLVQNASRYSPEGTTVALRAQRIGPTVRFAVEDEGPGIPPAERERVFDKFFRGAATKDTASGTGLGLAIARTLVELHGGSIWVEDGPTGRGARFVVGIPHEAVPAEVGA